MKLETRHHKVINQLNKDHFVFLECKPKSAQCRAITELYARNKIMIGSFVNGGVNVMLRQKIDYSKHII